MLEFPKIHPCLILIYLKNSVTQREGGLAVFLSFLATQGWPAMFPGLPGLPAHPGPLPSLITHFPLFARNLQLRVSLTDSVMESVLVL